MDSKIVNIYPLDKQFQALEHLADPKVNVVVYGGAVGGGKTFLLCLWLVHCCLTYAGTRYLLARKRHVDLRQSTLRTFRDVIKKLGVESQFVYNQNKNEIKCSNGSEILLRALDVKPSDESLAELSGLEITGAAWDEGEELHISVYRKINERMRYKLDEYKLTPKLLITTNPTKNFLFDIYKQHQAGLLPEHIRFIQALPKDNPELPKSYVDYLSPDNLGEAGYQVQALGNWEYIINDFDLFSYDDLDKMFDPVPWTKEEEGKYYITCDPATMGDRAVVMVWDRLHLVLVEQHQHMELSKLEHRIRALQDKFDVPNGRLVVDGGGLGISMVQNLRCVKFLANHRPVNTEQYKMLKDECYYRLSDYISNGLIKVNQMDIKQDLIKELVNHKQHNLNGEKKASVTPKAIVRKALNNKSPDLADAMMMRMVFEGMRKGPTMFRSMSISRG